MYKKCEELLKKLELQEKINVLSNFEFPPKQELKLRLKDMLEDEVDRKYYLSDEQVEKIKTSTFHTNARRIQEKDWCDTLCARDWKDPKCVAIKNATKKGYQEAYEGDSINLAYPESTTRRGRVGNQVAQTLQCSDNMGVVTSVAMRGRYDKNGIVKQQLEISNREVANALTTVQKDSMIAIDLEEAEYQEMWKADEEFERNGFQSTCPTGGVTIRKLTPKECWRLMGFDDTDIDKCIEIGMSNTQLYKQAR